jgi:DNA mismatch repair protein MutS
MDEVGRGTSTYDGLSLAWACVIDLSKRIKCLCLFATHYFELTELGKESGIDNYHVTAKELNGNLILLHKVQHGPASQSHGLQVAKLAGIPASVIKEAQNRLKILEKQQHQQVNKVVQNDLFSAIDEPAVEIIERVVEIEKDGPALRLLRSLDVDNLSPREALQQIYALKDALES